METKGELMKRGLIFLLTTAILITAGWYIYASVQDSRDRSAIIAAIPAMPDKESLEPIVHSALMRIHRQIETGKDPIANLGKLARTYQANGLLNEAIQVMDLLLKRDPQNAQWPHFLAFILAGYGELEVAIPLWERTMELTPDYIPAHLRRGEALMKLNRAEDAKDGFLRVLIKDPDNPHAFHGLARIYIDEQDYATARDYLTKAMTHSDGSVGIQLMVTVLDRLGETRKANAIRGMARTLEAYSDIPDQWINELMDDCYDPYQLFSGAGISVYAGDLQRGIELTKRALLYEPDYAYAYFQLATIYQQNGQLEEAIAHYTKATDLDPQLSDAWLRRSYIYLNSGNTEKADEILARGLANNPKSPALHLMYGERLFAKKRLDEAISVLQRSIELRPQEPEAYNMLARVHIERKHLEYAREFALKSLDAEAANPVGLTMAFLTSISLNDEASATKWLKEIDTQPRIKQEDRVQFLEYYENAFGRMPE